MPNITRISAGKSKKPSPDQTKPLQSKSQSSSQSTSHTTSVQPPKISKPPKSSRIAKFFHTRPVLIITFPLRFLIFRPLSRLFRYVKASWGELRQVHWPSRKATWKMTVVVIIYTLLFMVFILAVDYLMTLLFNQLLRK